MKSSEKKALRLKKKADALAQEEIINLVDDNVIPLAHLDRLYDISPKTFKKIVELQKKARREQIPGNQAGYPDYLSSQNYAMRSIKKLTYETIDEVEVKKRDSIVKEGFVSSLNDDVVSFVNEFSPKKKDKLWAKNNGDEIIYEDQGLGYYKINSQADESWAINPELLERWAGNADLVLQGKNIYKVSRKAEKEAINIIREIEGDSQFLVSSQESASTEVEDASVETSVKRRKIL